MRYAFKTAPMNTTWTAMVDVWRAADQLDIFESAWNFDHFEPIFSDRSGASTSHLGTRIANSGRCSGRTRPSPSAATVSGAR